MFYLHMFFLFLDNLLFIGYTIKVMKKQIKNTLPATQNASIMAARGVNDESGLAQYIQMVQKIPVLSAEQEYEYAIKWAQEKDSNAAEKLVASHLRLVVSVAYDYKNYGIPVGDLIASGNMGLMQALQKFDPEKGFRFSTYAMFWIKAEIYETILNNWSVVRIGTSANQKRVFFNLSRAKRALGIMDNNLSDEQTKQIAQYLEVPEKDEFLLVNSYHYNFPQLFLLQQNLFQNFQFYTDC